MTIKSDRWIRQMSDRPQGMIEPYEAGQVKQVDGQRIVSYGTSSYGYDVRCSREFKVFTNINSTIVDPKNFDPKSFVDVVADECIIPPNSFALARTVEYFRIPRRTGGLPGQEHLCALRDHRQRHPARAGMGGARDPGVLQHHAPAGPHLRHRGRGADAVLPAGRGLRDLLPRSRRQVPGADRRHPAADLSAVEAGHGTGRACASADC